MQSRWLGLVIALVFTLPACRDGGARTEAAPPAVERSAPRGEALSSFELETGELIGLSGLAIDGAGRLWVVPERQRFFVPVRATPAGAAVDGQPVPLRGVPDGLDTESLAWLGGNRFALGTETHRQRERDVVLLVELTEDAARVTGTVGLDYAPWGISVPDNNGIEGLCAAHGALLLAVETSLPRDGRRLAPLARYELDTGRWSHRLVRLTTRTGKLAGLECRALPSGDIEAIAIERHYGVARLLRFVVPREPSANELEPTIILDLGARFDPLPNFEGVTWIGPDTLALLNDNSSGKITGPTMITIWPAVAR